jgi:hypothetical protein
MLAALPTAHLARRKGIKVLCNTSAERAMFADFFRVLSTAFFIYPHQLFGTMSSKQKSKKQSNPSLFARVLRSVSITVHISTTLSLHHESLVIDTLLVRVT